MFYKTFSVTIDNNKSNIVGLRRFTGGECLEPDIVKKNTYFWNPGGNASQRGATRKEGTKKLKHGLRGKDSSITHIT